MTTESGAYEAGAKPCVGWEDEGSPQPTCWSGGCERLDREGSCPGYRSSEALRSGTSRQDGS